MQPVRIVQVDRSSGTATASLHAMLKGLPEADGGAPAARPVAGAGDGAPPPPPAPPPAPARKLTASERARKQQEEILRRMRGGA